jgi:hypothetical protein
MKTETKEELKKFQEKRNNKYRKWKDSMITNNMYYLVVNNEIIFQHKKSEIVMDASGINNKNGRVLGNNVILGTSY